MQKAAYRAEKGSGKLEFQLRFDQLDLIEWILSDFLKVDHVGPRGLRSLEVVLGVLRSLESSPGVLAVV